MMRKTLVLFTLSLLILASNAIASSNPIPGVGIVVKRPPGSSTARTTTDKDGNFKIEGLEPGTYTVEVVQAEVDKYFSTQTTGVSGKGARGEASGATTKVANNGNNGNAGNSGQAGGIAEMCITSCDQLTIDGSTKKAGENKFYESGSTLTVTVGPDGVISGQLRAGISTSRSNLRTKK
jgi:hypothetical protein